MAKVRWWCHLSATSADLRSGREMVRDSLVSMGCLPVMQDHLPPDYREVADMLKGKIAECDALIHIAGMRYGSEPDPGTLPIGGTRRSYTQLEYELAREMVGQPVDEKGHARLVGTQP